MAKFGKMFKHGQGACCVRVEVDGRTAVGLQADEARGVQTFKSADLAHAHYIHFAASNPSAWNVCYFLEDFIEGGE